MGTGAIHTGAMGTGAIHTGAIRIRAWVESWPIRGAFVISRGATTVSRVVVVEVEAEGVVGRGEGHPIARYGATPEDAVAELNALGKLDDVAWREIGWSSTLLPAGLCAAAQNALDCALWDWQAKWLGRSVWELANIPRPPRVSTLYTVSLGDPDAMAAEAAAHRAWPRLKLKLGGESDLERVRAVAAAVPDTRFTVDANEAWCFEQLLEWSEPLAGLRVDLIEQPLPADQDAILHDYRGPVPLCADESCHTAADLPSLVGRYAFVNIKLDKARGLSGALELIQAARAHGLRRMVGCMTGTSLAMAPATLVATECEVVDLDGALLLAKDRPAHLTYGDGWVTTAEPSVWG